MKLWLLKFKMDKDYNEPVQSRSNGGETSKWDDELCCRWHKPDLRMVAINMDKTCFEKLGESSYKDKWKYGSGCIS